MVLRDSPADVGGHHAGGVFESRQADDDAAGMFQEEVMKARFIELHGELVEARAELRLATQVCRSHFVASGPLEPVVAIRYLREIQKASDVVDRAAFALERYLISHPK